MQLAIYTKKHLVSLQENGIELAKKSLIPTCNRVFPYNILERNRRMGEKLFPYFSFLTKTDGI